MADLADRPGFRTWIRAHTRPRAPDLALNLNMNLDEDKEQEHE